MTETFVVAGGPIRNRGWIVSKSIDAILANGVEQLYYLVNDCEDDTIEVLERYPQVTYQVWNTGYHGWQRGSKELGGQDPNRYSYDNLAKLRNKWAQSLLAFFPEATHAWNVDSDIAPGPGSLKLLLESGKPAIANAVPCSPSACNFTLGKDDLGARRNGQELLRINDREPFVVTVTGACMLLSREVLENCKWSDHFRSEDNSICMEMAEKGYGPWLHPLARGTHYMSPDPKTHWTNVNGTIPVNLG